MKRTIIVALLCVNVGLLLALIVASSDRAYGQVYTTDYLVVTGQVAGDWEAVYVLDLGRRRLLALGFDKQKKRVAPFGGGKDLKTEFVSKPTR